MDVRLQPLELRPRPEGLGTLARKAGEGEVLQAAAAVVDSTRAALEMEGWVLIHQVRFSSGAAIQHGLIGTGGVIVMVPCGRVPRSMHLAEAEREAVELARELGMRRTEVTAAVVLYASDAVPAMSFDGDSAVVLVGDQQLHHWLTRLPTVLAPEIVDDLRGAISQSAADARAQKPLLLPATPNFG
jgi:hypothetical protein